MAEKEADVDYAHLSRKGRNLVDALHRDCGPGCMAGKFVGDVASLIQRRYRAKYAAFITASRKRGEMTAIYAC